MYLKLYIEHLKHPRKENQKIDPIVKAKNKAYPVIFFQIVLSPSSHHTSRKCIIYIMIFLIKD